MYPYNFSQLGMSPFMMGGYQPPMNPFPYPMMQQQAQPMSQSFPYAAMMGGPQVQSALDALAMIRQQQMPVGGPMGGPMPGNRNVAAAPLGKDGAVYPTPTGAPTTTTEEDDNPYKWYDDGTQGG